MAKVTKTNMAVTVDSWIYQWISEQPNKKSRTVNEILKKHILATDPEPKRQKTLLELKGEDKKKAMEAHMSKVWGEMGYTSDGKYHLCCMEIECKCDNEEREYYLPDHLSNIDEAIKNRRKEE